MEYEDVCCTLIAWDNLYTFSGVPMHHWVPSITVNNMSTSPETGTPNNTLYLVGVGNLCGDGDTFE